MDALIRTFYLRHLGRLPERAGVESWKKYLQKKNRTIEDLEKAIASSKEAEEFRKRGCSTPYSPPIDIVLPFHDNGYLTIKAIVEIQAHTHDYHLYIIDDASMPSESALVDRYVAERTRATFIRNERNLGFQESVRRGVQLGRSPYVCVINSDVFVRKGWKEKLLAPFLSSTKTMITGAFGGMLSPVFLGRATRENRDADYVEFSCAVFRRVLLRFMDLWDENLQHAYGEDADLSLRARQMGFQIEVVPGTGIIHLGNQSYGQKKDTSWRECANRNLTYLQKKWSDYLLNRSFRTTNVLFQREGAYGDVLLLEPAIRAFQIEHPSSRIHLRTRCFDSYLHHPLVTPFICNLEYENSIDFNLCYESDPKKPIIDAYVDRLGLPKPKPPYPLFFLEPVSDFLTSADFNGPYVVACSEGSWENRTLPLETFKEVLLHLRDMGYRILEVGSNAAMYCGVGSNFKGRTSVQELAALVKGAAFCIGHDSLLLHVAEAMSTKGAYVFSCIDPQFRIHRPDFSIPVRLEALPCLGCHHEIEPPITFSECKRKRRRNACVQDLTSKHFLTAIAQLKEEAVNEAAKYEYLIDRYMKGSGLDLGSGGFRVSERALCVDRRDLENVDIVDDIQYLIETKKRFSAVDFILASHCLEHLKDPKAAIRDWWPLLKEGGYLIIILPHPKLYLQPNPEHLHEIFPETVEEYVEGLEVERVFFLTDEGMKDPNLYSFLLVYRRLAKGGDQ